MHYLTVGIAVLIGWWLNRLLKKKSRTYRCIVEPSPKRTVSEVAERMTTIILSPLRKGK